MLHRNHQWISYEANIDMSQYKFNRSEHLGRYGMVVTQNFHVLHHEHALSANPDSRWVSINFKLFHD